MKDSGPGTALLAVLGASDNRLMLTPNPGSV